MSYVVTNLQASFNFRHLFYSLHTNGKMISSFLQQKKIQNIIPWHYFYKALWNKKELLDRSANLG